MILTSIEMKHIPPLNTPVSSARSSSLPWQITALIVLGVTLSSTRFVAAQDTTPPARFELLIPENNATTYATVYGDTPLFAWRASSDRESGIAHYEVWLDGAKVDEIPAGTLRSFARRKVTGIMSLSDPLVCWHRQRKSLLLHALTFKALSGVSPMVRQSCR